ncbi:hypothetical protein BC834DRAFT_972699 [Gloeopeniophorella convolvens]|nr:hypothetical protein BC834DRAFT_972699 [Gloeopeniophorella convolvens]
MICKLETKSATESAVMLGLPLPASLPSLAFLMKLHLNMPVLCGAASTPLSIGIMELHSMHVPTGAVLRAALVHTWLGTDAGMYNTPSAVVRWFRWAAHEPNALCKGGEVWEAATVLYL